MVTVPARKYPRKRFAITVSHTISGVKKYIYLGPAQPISATIKVITKMDGFIPEYSRAQFEGFCGLVEI